MYEVLPSYKLNVPKEQGAVTPARWLCGLLAPFANADSFPLSFVNMTTLLSYSPIGDAEITIPVTVIN